MKPLILILDKGGFPVRWSDWTDAVLYKTKDLVAWELPEEHITIRGGYNKLTHAQSQITISTIMSVKHVNCRPSQSLPLTNQNLFRRDLYTCAYCGHTYPTSKLTRDHIVPSSKGGSTTWANVITACRACNGFKGNHNLADIDMEIRYRPYVPTRAEVMIFQNRKITQYQYDFLTSLISTFSRTQHLQPTEFNYE